MEKKIIIAGSGGFAKEVLTMIIDLGFEDRFLGFSEPDEVLERGGVQKGILNFPVLPYSSLDVNQHMIALAIGNSKIREKIVVKDLKGFDFITLIHPNTTISKWVKIGEGSIICSGCILTVDIQLGNFAQLNLGTTIGHDCIIDEYFTTAPNVNISGSCQFDRHVYFGTAACIKQGLRIVNDVTIGMGAVVTKDILESGIYVGMPAVRLK